MVDKKKDRHHKQNDAAYREIQRIEPIIHVDTVPVVAEHTKKTNAYHNSDEKFTAKRENKKTHQHTFRHEQIFRVHDSKRGE